MIENNFKKMVNINQLSYLRYILYFTIILCIHTSSDKIFLLSDEFKPSITHIIYQILSVVKIFSTYFVFLKLLYLS